MIINHKGSNVEVSATEDHVTVYRVGKRKKYIAKSTGQPLL